jgi:hypothetical protein
MSFSKQAKRFMKVVTDTLLAVRAETTVALCSDAPKCPALLPMHQQLTISVNCFVIPDVFRQTAKRDTSYGLDNKLSPCSEFCIPSFRVSARRLNFIFL